MKRYALKTERGIAMIVVLMFLTLLSVIVLTISYLSNQSTIQSRLQGETDASFFAAQAALNLKAAEVTEGDMATKSGPITDGSGFYNVQVYLPSDSIPELPTFTIPPDHIYIVSKGYPRDPSLSGPKPRQVVLGALFRRASTVFTAAALAGQVLTISDSGHTDTWDPVTNTPGNHALSNVGVFRSTGTVSIDSTAHVGFDGSSALAEVVVPIGHSGTTSGTGTLGSEFAAVRTDPFLKPPDPVPVRVPGATDLNYVGPPPPIVPTTIYTPTLLASEYVFKVRDLNVSGYFRLDVSSVPHGETVHIDVQNFNITNGLFEVFDSDVSSYGTGSATEVKVELYASGTFSATADSKFLFVNNDPERLQVFSTGDMLFRDLAQSYMVARSAGNVTLSGLSSLYGAILADGDITIEDSARVRYYEKLATGGGSTGAGTLVFVNFQRL